MISSSICNRKSRYSFFVTISAAPNRPPAAAGSSVMTAVPPSMGSSTIFHLIGIEDLNPGPSQYFHFASSISREPSSSISAPSSGLAPTPMSAFTELERTTRLNSSAMNLRSRWVVVISFLRFARGGTQNCDSGRKRSRLQSSPARSARSGYDASAKYRKPKSQTAGQGA